VIRRLTFAALCRAVVASAAGVKPSTALAARSADSCRRTGDSLCNPARPGQVFLSAPRHEDAA
jgi:hypothetical protein